MADFLLAIPGVLDFEGGFVDDPDDPGGRTKYGISQRAYPDEDIACLTEPRALEIYLNDYWLPLLLDDIEDQPTANYIFDMAVNHGRRRAVRIAQQAANVLGAGLEADGRMGPLTLDAINDVNLEQYLEELFHVRVDFYEDIVRRRPSSRKFLRGWLRRARRG